ncbi:hypothetical protein EC973_000053 [Apophysomyces ossiformis]|uniref:Uncharacterized protein n=1 Tax=Apophysomyces ossiformis TaxID=679940 RepID=A0A8H7BWZ1_9FUNG|nr:hypothetical protein EC973_000053 [Apophysomyces ossiformis]
MKETLGMQVERSSPPHTPVDTDGIRARLDAESQSPIRIETSLIERLMPIQFECTTGSLIIGNAELPTMIVIEAAQANGIWSTVPSRTTMDYYKSVIDLVLRKPQLSFKDNVDYTNVAEERKTAQTTKLTWLFSTSRAKHYGEILHMNDLLRSKRDRSVPDDTENTTYHEEYGRVNNVFECSEMAITFYADSPGPVRSSTETSSASAGVGIDVGNGGLPPEWGVRLSLWNAMVHYGPWTDRHRALIQDYFFPTSYRDSQPTTRLEPGQLRLATAFELYVELMTEATLRIPTREKSKDWKYELGSAELDLGADGYYTRPYGWLDIKAAKESTLKSVTPFVIGSDGCISTLKIDLKNVDISTSVNYASLVQADKFEIHLSMPSPLKWNAHRVWDFNVSAKRPRVFLLRDHVFLFQDMIKDWASTPPVDLLYFIPMTYTFNIDLTEPLIYLCVNEHNIISNPNAIDDNAFIKLNSHELRFNATLPFNEYKPEVNVIRFKADVQQCKVGISLQTSHTLNAFLKEDNAQFGVSVNVAINGSYEFYSVVDVMRHIETLNLHVKLDGVTVKLFGTVIRYLFILKDNYVGSWLNFCTIDEYRQRRSNPEEWLEMKRKQAESKTVQDPFEVYVLLEVQDGALTLLENLYDCTQYSQLEFQELQLELRNLDIYMDMHVNISPITWTRDSNPNPNTKRGPFRVKNARDTRNYIYIDGKQIYYDDRMFMQIIETNIYAHRLFGPLPETATYLCNWQFDVGRITGELKPSFLLGATNFAQTFVYNLIDEDNAVPAEMMPAELPDVTFVKASVREVDIFLMSYNSATEIQLMDGVNAEFDNLINERYSQKIGLKVPTILAKCLANEEPSRQDDEFSWVEVAKMEMGMNITVFRHTKDWRRNRAKQQKFIREEDAFARRCTYLYETDDKSQSSARTSHDYHVGVIYAPPFRSYHNEGGQETRSICETSSCLTLERSGDERLRNYRAASDAPSVASYVGDWSVSDESSYDSDEEHVGLHTDVRSLKSTISRDNESFYTANSDDTYPTIQKIPPSDSSDYGADEGMSDASISEDEAMLLGEANLEQPAKLNTESSIPPSIPYSGYLQRYAMKRATPLTGHNRSFFHPYLPPPKTSFVPHNEDSTKQGHASTPFRTESWTNTYFPEPDYELDEPTDENDEENNDSKGNEVTATTVLEATSPVTILVTPILVKIVQEVTEAINKDDWDLETMLDSLQIEYVSQLTRYLTDQFVCTRFAVLLPRTYLHFIQNVVVPDDLPSYKHGQSHIKTQYDLDDTLLCSADIFLNGLRMIGSVKFQDFAFDEKQRSVAESKLVLQESRVHIDIDRLGCKVQYVSERHDARQPITFGIPRTHQQTDHEIKGYCENDGLSNKLVMIDLKLDRLSCRWLGARKPNCLSLEIDDLSTIIITEAVEILVGAVYSWLVFVDDLKGILESFQDRRSRQIQVFIDEIATYSNGPEVVSDPLFLTKPTNMLRLGSRNFRNDVGWKLLARMRHCLRSMRSSMRERLQYRLTSGNAIQHINSAHMFKNVVHTFSCWRSWEIDAEAISTCRLLTQPFKQQAVTDGMSDANTVKEFVAFLTSSANVGKLQVRRFHFRIYEEEEDEEGMDANSVIFAPVEFVLESVYKRPMIGAVPEEYSGTHKTDEYQAKTGEDGYLDVVTKVSIGSIRITTNPTILAFARHMLMVQRVFTARLSSLSHATKSSIFSRDLSMRSDGPIAVADEEKSSLQALVSKIDIVAQALVFVNEVDICARAQKLTMQTDIKGIKGSALFSNPKLTPLPLFQSSEKADSDTGSGRRSSNRASRKNVHINNRLILEAAGGVEVIHIQFYEMLYQNHPLVNKLLEFTMDGANVNANLSHPTRTSKKQMKTEHSRDVLNIFSNIQRFSVHAPQNLLRLYGFVEDWRTEQGQRYHFMFQNLINEWEEQRKTATPLTGITRDTESKKYDIKLQFLLNHFAARSDLLPSLSIEYSISDFFVMVHEVQQKLGELHKYTFQLSKQEIQIITKTSPQISSGNSSQMLSDYPGGTFGIPGIRSTGCLKREISSGKSQLQLRSTISVDFISLSLNVGMIDSLLTAQSLLGNEISELLEVLSYSKQRKNQESSPSAAEASLERDFKYYIQISLEGLSISAESPSALVLFESNLLEASVSNEGADMFMWKAKGRNFALSLDHNADSLIEEKSKRKSEVRYRRNRLAYIVIDFDVQNFFTNEADQQLESFDVYLSKVQTVMQPIALGKLAEMYIYYDSELKKRKKMKKMELERLATNTKRLVRSFKNDAPKSEESVYLLKGKLLSLRVQRLGVAVPLDLVPDAPRQSSREVSALLFTIASANFVTKNIETSSATLENITLQFVKKFDQMNEDHFLADKHARMNQMYLPSIACHVYTSAEGPQRFVKIDANVGGFEVDVDGAIADYINNLSVIYVKCMDRVDAFTAKANLKGRPETVKETASDGQVVHLDIEGVFEYHSGVVRMYPKRHSGEASRKKNSVKSLKIKPGEIYSNLATDANVATIKLPGLSIRTTYQTRLGADASMSTAPKLFHGDILVHECENVLHPSLVQFLREVVAGLKVGIQQSTERKAVRDTEADGIALNASLFLRLSRSKLDLSCQPLSKVVCSLSWDEGEFLMTSFSDERASRTMSCAGSISNIAAQVKHHFSPEACLTAKVDRFLVNAMLSSQPGEEKALNDDDISIVLKVSSIEADLNIRHLQDLLILNAHWFGQPQNSPSPKPLKETTPEEMPMSHSTRPFAKYFAFEASAASLSVDMGQAIGKIILEPKSFILNTYNVPQASVGLNVFLHSISVSSEGRLCGDASFKRIIIEGQVQLKDGVHTSSFRTVLDGFRATCEYEYQNILDLTQGPISFYSNIKPGDNAPYLTATMDVRPLVARLSIKTVPVIITMYRRFNELLDKKKAEAGVLQVCVAQESTTEPTFASDQSPAKQICSTTSICLHSVDVVIHPNQFQDTDNVAIRVRQLKMSLDQIAQTDVRRLLLASFVSAALLKNVPGAAIMKHQDEKGGTNIFGVPSTKLTMESSQQERTVHHAFSANFDGRINVSLNLGLIKYLQEMSHMFTTQLQRALDDGTVRPVVMVQGSSSVDNRVDTHTKPPEGHSMPVESREALSASTSNELIYIIKQPVDFYPQLQVMGDATPPVEWLGLKREKLPAIIHENITLRLDQIVHAMWALSETQAHQLEIMARQETD